MRTRKNILFGASSISLVNRFAAKTIDVLMVLVLYLIVSAVLPVLGGVIAVAFTALQDGFGEGQSVGKRMMGLQVIEEPHGLNCSWLSSMIRNVPVTLALGLSLIGPLRVFAVILGIPWIVLEIYLLLSLESGSRLGDILANTAVVDFNASGHKASI